MLLSRRLRKARRTTRRYLRHALRLLDAHPAFFDESAREHVGRHVEACEAAMLGGDAARIERSLHRCRDYVDAHLPWRRRSSVRENVQVVIIAVLLFLVIRTFVVQAFKIPSGSMIPTLRIGDHILVTKFSYGIPIPFTDRKVTYAQPTRGDIIVFRFPNDPTKDYIKRVIAVPGDVLKIKGHEVWVNGERLAREQIGKFRYNDPPGYEQTSALFTETIDGREHRVLYDGQANHFTDMVRRVPPGKFFCMGDNRDHSNDSRFWGFVPEENIHGRALFIYFSWPPGQFRRIARWLR